MKTVILFASFLIGSALCAQTRCEPEDTVPDSIKVVSYDELVRKGDSALASKDSVEARELWIAALQIYQPCSLINRLYMVDGLHDDDCNDTINNLHDCFLAGSDYYANGDYETARCYFQNGFSYNPNKRQTWVLRKYIRKCNRRLKGLSRNT